MQNKIIIPTALVGVILIAGVFALMPVQQASTVHGTIGSLQTLTKSDTDFDVGENLDFTCTAAFEVVSMIIDVNAALDNAGDNIDLIVDPDGAGGDALITLDADIENNAAPVDVNLFRTHGPFGGEANGFVRLNFQAEGGADNGEVITAHYVYRSGGTCS